MTNFSQAEIQQRRAIMKTAVDSHPILLDTYEVVICERGVALFQPGPFQWEELLFSVRDRRIASLRQEAAYWREKYLRLRGC